MAAHGNLPESDDELDVRAAAEVAGRTAETIRRWVWSGALPARKRGSRLMVSRTDVQFLARSRGGRGAPLTLAEWAARARGGRPPRARRETSAADLVLEDRLARPGQGGAGAGS